MSQAAPPPLPAAAFCWNSSLVTGSIAPSSGYHRCLDGTPVSHTGTMLLKEEEAAAVAGSAGPPFLLLAIFPKQAGKRADYALPRHAGDLSPRENLSRQGEEEGTAELHSVQGVPSSAEEEVEHHSQRVTPRTLSPHKQ